MVVPRAARVAGAFSKLPSALPAIFVHLLWGRDRTRLSGGAGADGWLCHRSTHSHDLLFRVLLRHPAAAGTVRKNQAATEFDLRIGVAARRFSRRIDTAASQTGLTVLVLPASLASRSTMTREIIDFR